MDTHSNQEVFGEILRKRNSTEAGTFSDNPSFYSYESVVESFLDSNQYSDDMQQRFKRYKELLSKTKTEEENKEFLKLKTDLEMMSPALKELYIAFQDLDKKRRTVKNG